MEIPLVAKIVGIGVALFVLAAIVPSALNSLANSTTAVAMPNVDSSVRTLLAVLVPIAAVVGILMYLFTRE